MNTPGALQVVQLVVLALVLILSYATEADLVLILLAIVLRLFPALLLALNTVAVGQVLLDLPVCSAAIP